MLVNTAGAVRSKRTETAEGLEFQFALNYLSSFLLTKLLLPALKKAEGAVVCTGSDSHVFARRLRWRDLMFTRGYGSLRAYAQSKLALMLFSAEARQRWHGVLFYVVDPGLVKTEIGEKNTKGLTRLFWNLRKRRGTDPMLPAQTYVHVIYESPQELYFFRNKPQKKQSKASKNLDEAKRLFECSEHLCKNILETEH